MKPRPYDFKLRWFGDAIKPFWSASLLRGKGEWWAVKVSGKGFTPDEALDDMEIEGQVMGLL